MNGFQFRLGILLVSFTLPLWADAAVAGWHTNYETAQIESQSTSKPLLLHFHASWCGPCRTMESRVLNTQDVQDILNDGLIGVKVDADRRRDLVSRFGIRSLPTDVIVAPDGRVLLRAVGAASRSSYVARLQRFRVPDRTPAATPSHQTEVATNTSSDSPGIPVVDNSVTPEVTGSSVRMTSASVSVKASRETEDRLLAEQAVDAGVRKALAYQEDKRLGLNGFSPVALTVSSQWKAGSRSFAHEYQGVCYLLSSQQELDAFRAAPQNFIPWLHGCDPVAFQQKKLIQAGALRFGATYQQRAFFFTTAGNRDAFLKEPSKFTQRQEVSFVGQPPQSATGG